MPGMGNELVRSKKKLEEQEIINQDLQKNISKKKLEEQEIINQDLQKNISSVTEHSISLFCL